MNFPKEGDYGSSRFEYRDGKLETIDSVFLALERADGLLVGFDAYVMEKFGLDNYDSTMVCMMMLIRDDIRVVHDLVLQAITRRSRTSTTRSTGAGLRLCFSFSA